MQKGYSAGKGYADVLYWAVFMIQLKYHERNNVIICIKTLMNEIIGSSMIEYMINYMHFGSTLCPWISCKCTLSES